MKVIIQSSPITAFVSLLLWSRHCRSFPIQRHRHTPQMHVPVGYDFSVRKSSRNLSASSASTTNDGSYGGGGGDTRKTSIITHDDIHLALAQLKSSEGLSPLPIFEIVDQVCTSLIKR